MVKVFAVSVRPDSVGVEFDDERLIANAGLVLVATLSIRLGIEQLVDKTVSLGQRAGAAQPGRKVLSLIHAIAAGADSIDDADVLRAGGTEALLGHRAMAPSTLGTFLRAFTFGHVRQLDRVLGEAIKRAWAAGAGPGASRLTTYGGRRLIVRRVHLHAQDEQTELFAYWRHFAFLTNRSEDMHTVDAEHRQHAEVELAIRDLKDQALAHFPSGQFNANAAWTVIACLAHNMVRWVGQLGLRDSTWRTARTIRRWLIAMPGRLTRTARRFTLHLPARWPWQAAFVEALSRIRALPAAA